MEKIEFPFEVKTLLDTDSKNYILEGLANTFFNTDKDNDISIPGMFIESLKVRAPVILWYHNFMDVPIGIADINGNNATRETDQGLFLKGLLPKDDTFVKGRIVPQVKVGSIKKLSIGYNVLDSEIRSDGVRLLKKVDLHEISLVALGEINQESVITGIKAITGFRKLPMADRKRTWDSGAAIKRIKSFTKSNEKPSASYKKAFMWYDSTKSDQFGSYKLPFIDIIDGKMTAIPRALFAIKAVLGGGRGGVNIPESDKTKIRTVLDKYLSKVEGKKAYDSLDILEIKSKYDFNDLLKSLGCFTRTARENLSAQFVPRLSKSADGNQSKSEKLVKDIQDYTDKLKSRL